MASVRSGALELLVNSMSMEPVRKTHEFGCWTLDIYLEENSRGYMYCGFTSMSSLP